MLAFQIDSAAHARQGRAINNFSQRLPAPQSDLVQQALKDPYIFDFLTLEPLFHERELETGLIQHLEKFLLELGQGFAFVGRQYHLSVGDSDFYPDLLFYHLKDLRDFITCYHPQNRHERMETDRFKYYSYADLIARDKASLDLFWLKDDSLDNLDDLPPPDVLQQEIIEHLEAALAAFRDVAASLPPSQVDQASTI